MSKLKIGIVQQTCSESRETNIEKSLKGIADCATKGAQLIILQELHCGIYFCQVERTWRCLGDFLV
jgi:N-carbamoylputrescine amidase